MVDQRRRAVLTRTWVVAVLAWSVFRCLVVSHTLHRYGVSPWSYGAVDLASSWPYAVASAGVVTSLLDRRMASARRNGMVAGAAFLIPDLYLMVAGHGKPKLVYCVVGSVCAVFAVAALVSIAMQVRAGRREPSPAI